MCTSLVYRLLLVCIVSCAIPASLSSAQAASMVPTYNLAVDLSPKLHQMTVSGTIVIPPSPNGYTHVHLKLSKLMHDFKVHQLVGASEEQSARADVVPGGGAPLTYDVVLLHPVRASDPLRLRFSYAGGEKRGFVFSLEGPTYYAAGGNTAWYPQLDDNDRGEGKLAFRIPRDMTVIASGRRVGPVSPGAAFFEVPVPMHLSFAAARYHVTRLAGPIPVTGYTLKRRADLRGYLTQVQRVISGLSHQFGRYPYPAISLAEVPRHQANNTGFDGASVEGIVLLSDYSFDDRFSVAFFGHELSHQWWGNSITALGTEGNAMLDEGMAQFGALTMVTSMEGPAAGERFRRDGDPSLASTQSARGYFQMAAAGLDHPLANLPKDSFVSHELANNKGAIVLEQLAGTIGRNRFSEALHDITRDHAFQSIQWSDFLSAVERRAGQDLGWLYSQWFERTGAPDIQLKWFRKGSGITLLLRQSAPLYRLSIPVEVTLATGAEKTVYVDIEGATTSFDIPDVVPKSVDLDPHYQILRWTAEYRSEADALVPITRAYFLRTEGKSNEAAQAYEAVLQSVSSTHDPWGLRFRARRGLASIDISNGNWAAVTTELKAALAEPNPPPSELPWAYQYLAQAAKALDDQKLLGWAVQEAVAADHRLSEPTGAGRAAQALID
jgi:hypothetical protein